VGILPESVSVNGEVADRRYEEAQKTLVVRVAEGAGEVALEVKF